MGCLRARPSLFGSSVMTGLCRVRSRDRRECALAGRRPLKLLQLVARTVFVEGYASEAVCRGPVACVARPRWHKEDCGGGTRVGSLTEVGSTDQAWLLCIRPTPRRKLKVDVRLMEGPGLVLLTNRT